MSELEATSEEAALDMLHELSCTDGLPVVIPSPERVARMVLATGMDADYVLGELGPLMGAATVELVATAAVMAGCLPDHASLVVAAVRAIADPRLDLTEMQSTTHCMAPLIIVNGPIRFECSIASGYGALGPGHRGNATVGRALRLVMMNIGGARPGISDMSLIGHPGKFTYCLAEAEEESPWEPLHVSFGFEPTDSVVTVIGAEAPSSVIADPRSADAAARILNGVVSVFSAIACNNATFCQGSGIVVLNPEHAAALANAGYSRRAVQVEIADRSGNPRSELPEILAPGSGDFARAFHQPEDILVLVAGAGGGYSMAIPTWGGGDHKNTYVSVQVDTGQVCEIPVLTTVR